MPDGASDQAPTGPQERAQSAPRARPEHAPSTPRARPECWMAFRRLEKVFPFLNPFSNLRNAIQHSGRTRGVLGACSGRALGALGARSCETPRRGRGPVGAWSAFPSVETAFAWKGWGDVTFSRCFCGAPHLHCPFFALFIYALQFSSQSNPVNRATIHACGKKVHPHIYAFNRSKFLT